VSTARSNAVGSPRSSNEAANGAGGAATAAVAIVVVLAVVAAPFLSAPFVFTSSPQLLSSSLQLLLAKEVIFLSFWNCARSLLIFVLAAIQISTFPDITPGASVMN